MFLEEKKLIEVLKENEGKGELTLREIMKQLRHRCGGFTDTEAILHMMEALVIETMERRGW